MGMLKEFKEFAMRGNVVDMAVGVVIGAAFGKIVSAAVEKIIMPVVGVVTGGVDFSKYDKEIKAAVTNADGTTTEPVVLGIGSFVTTVVDFIIVAFAIFLAIKMMNTLKKRFEEEKEEAPKAPPEEIALLREIRDSLQK